ncbi:hypothetical protein B4N89_45825 [Embleya scabrispora]|uniref:Uncharacterized protein n=1 Tax=Embleya scabrispora TaxID=159449 RepID=A0A1T3NIY6_9ACTN|nr:hypothetical protein [Embleya scabrispora]OPC76797.1 hypothetical protein B4N89_45825 [Embleya scabrispora]
MTPSAITHALNQCSDPGRALFARLGLLPGVPLTTRAVAALDGDASRAAQAVAELHERDLVTDARDTPGFHVVTTAARPVSESKAAELPTEERDAARTRLLDYHLAASADAARTLHPERRQLEATGRGPGVPAVQFADTGEALLWSLAELPAVMADIRHCAGTREGWRSAAVLADCLWSCALRVDIDAEVREAHRLALDAARLYAGPDADGADVLGRMLTSSGLLESPHDPELSLRLLLQAEEHHRTHGRPREAACAVHYRARTHAKLGQDADADTTFLHAIRLCHTAGDHRTAGLAYLERALAAYAAGRNVHAAAYGTTARHLLAQARDVFNTALADHCCGRALLAADAPEEARPHLVEALTGLRRAGDTKHIDAVLADLAACDPVTDH